MKSILLFNHKLCTLSYFSILNYMYIFINLKIIIRFKNVYVPNVKIHFILYSKEYIIKLKSSWRSTVDDFLPKLPFYEYS